MKQALLFTLSFTVVSLVLTWLWLAGGNVLYAELMTPIAREIYEGLGMREFGSMRRARFINLVPFAALMLLTPRLSFRRRFGGLALGLVVLSISHIALNGFATFSTTRTKLPLGAALLSDAMPFLLWFVLGRSFIQETLRRVRGEPEGDPPPGAKEAPRDEA